MQKRATEHPHSGTNSRRGLTDDGGCEAVRQERKPRVPVCPFGRALDGRMWNQAWHGHYVIFGKTLPICVTRIWFGDTVGVSNF